jgi:biotin transport system substrate-specific component
MPRSWRASANARLLRSAPLVVAGSVLTALSAHVSIPLPFTPVPITGQTFAVLLVGAALGSRLGAASMAL